MMNKYPTNIKKHLNGLIKETSLNLLKQISSDYKIELDELKKKYIYNIASNKKTNKRKISAYTVFLSDMDIEEKIKTEQNIISRKEIFKHKGIIWKKMTEEDKETYRIQANSINNSRNKKDGFL